MRQFAAAALVVAALFVAVPARGGEADIASDKERQVVYYSPWAGCIGNPATPFCALETLFSCMVRGDWEMCALVGVPADADCRPSHITGVRYIVDWLVHRGGAAYVNFRAEVCRDDRPCPAPSSALTEELELTAGTWRFQSMPRVYAQACGAKPIGSL